MHNWNWTGPTNWGTLAVSLRRMLSALKAKVSEADALSREAGLKSQEAEQARFVAEESHPEGRTGPGGSMLQAAGKLGHVVGGGVHGHGNAHGADRGFRTENKRTVSAGGGNGYGH